MRVFVIVVTYKGKQWYDRCFSSLRESVFPVQTIVIDNASNDGSVDYIRRYYPEIHLIESQKNLGFGRANNLGIRYALDHDCDYVFLLNQDAWIEEYSIRDLIHIHKQNSQFGILSPMHLRADEKSLYIQIEDGKLDHGNKLLADCYFNQLEDVYPFRYINAAAWLVPRGTLEVVGGFTPIFLHYGEDDDYLNRLHYHGLKLGLCPKVRIVHDHQETPNPLSGGRLRYYYSLLVGFVDPGKEDTFSHYLRSLRRKIFTDFLKGKTEMARCLIRDYRFFFGERDKVRIIRKTNKEKQPSWL